MELTKQQLIHMFIILSEQLAQQLDALVNKNNIVACLHIYVFIKSNEWICFYCVMFNQNSNLVYNTVT